MSDLPPPVHRLAERLRTLGGVEALWVAGSAATGDHVPGVSDLDLVALLDDDDVDDARRQAIADLHADLDAGDARGADLGCVYVGRRTLPDPARPHLTWTHGRSVQRILSGVTRAELVRCGVAVFGPAPSSVLPPLTDDDVRRAARDELTGYWATTVRHPWWFLDPTLAELGLTSAARGRHAMTYGALLTKSAAIEQVAGPAWLVERLRARRRGRPVPLPRIRTAVTTWRDLRRTVAVARRNGQ